MTDLTTISTQFGRAYERKDKAQKWLAKQQAKLFAAFTNDLASQPLGRRSVKLDTLDIQDDVKAQHPGYRWVSTSKNASGDWYMILEEDPALMKHSFVNHETGMVYGRTYAEGGPSLDDEKLREENPELWERITEWPEPWYSLIRDIIVRFTHLSWGADALESTVGDYLAESGIQRVLVNFDNVNDHDLALIEPYFVPGARTVRLIPPRKATQEELDNG